MTLIVRSSRALVGASFRGADIVLENGIISEINELGSFEDCHDFGDALLVPGFVDLHSDAVEKEIEPRPGASFPVENAIVELDKKLALCGITTMFHAIAFFEEEVAGLRGCREAAELVRAVVGANRNGLGVDNLVHARYEVTAFTALPLIIELISSGCVNLLSFMDHSPGQGQFNSVQKWLEFHISYYKMSEGEARELIASQLGKKDALGTYMEHLSQCAREHGLVIASHDDDSPEKVQKMKELGVSIAEFPMNVSTALSARQLALATGMGAPNVVRGLSQNGNVSARELVREGLCDFLCSDYHPSSMLQAVFALHRELGMDLATGFALITVNPAKAAGLDDRGIIRPGAVADIVAIDDARIPRVIMTIKGGRSVYNGLSCFCH